MENSVSVIEKHKCNDVFKVKNGQLKITNKLKKEDLEINIYEMSKGNHYFFLPPKEKNSIETYYILDGEIFNYDTGKSYSVGDIIYLDNKKEPFNLYVKSDLRVLGQSLHENSFSRSYQLFSNIDGIMNKIYKKDDYTGKHSQKVFQYTKLLAVKLQYSGERLRNILDAAKYHDVGKIYIEDYILKKPTLLTDQEFMIMKTHVVKGRELILSCFNEEVFHIISQHHERIDGSGYPNGLTEKEIREEAKIIAICDSFEAMTSDRVYKKGNSFETAAVELKKLSGIKYDSRLVNVFVNEVLPQVKKEHFLNE